MKKDSIEDIYSGLEGFSKVPPKELWDNIEARLHPKKRKKRGIIFLWGSAAAILVLLLGYIITGSPESSDKPTKEITDIEYRTDNDTIKESEIQTTEIDNEANTTEDSLNYSLELLEKMANQNKLSEKSENLNKEEERLSSTEKGSSNEEKLTLNINYPQSITKDNIGKGDERTSLASKLKNKSIRNFSNERIVANIGSVTKFAEVDSFGLAEELIAIKEDSKDDMDIKTDVSPKWSVEVLGGLSNTVSESSLQGASVNTTPQNDFVYAFKLGYSISDRLIVKSGIGKNILGQEINNVLYSSSDTSLSADTSQSIVSDQSVFIFGSQESFTDVSSFEGNINEGNLQQQFDYIQLPIEVSYDLLSQPTYNVSLGIGGNINFLANNRAFLNNEGIGESLGVNSTIFGATINSNVSYKLTKELNLFLEPSYNYFQKPIDNNNQNFENTQFRALFGLRYRF
ncbi:anti-sigma factor [uncultured Winogradskyella sp.]|uniref:anti-sigma factor n=1 Tax=uncultured Winogradskyella sp. TaxID=395353 RepID=UPI002621CF37|nr:anti-sigma factor [uncultured Winogradskyella sp.]